MLTVRWPACHVAVAGGVWAGQWASSPRIGPVNRRVESERCVETRLDWCKERVLSRSGLKTPHLTDQPGPHRLVFILS